MSGSKRTAMQTTPEPPSKPKPPVWIFPTLLTGTLVLSLYAKPLVEPYAGWWVAVILMPAGIALVGALSLKFLLKF